MTAGYSLKIYCDEQFFIIRELNGSLPVGEPLPPLSSGYQRATQITEAKLGENFYTFKIIDKAQYRPRQDIANDLP